MKTNTGEKSVSVRLEQLHPFEHHSFRVVEDDALRQLTQSIRENGVLTPCIVRPSPCGGYELLSGHRRVAACRPIGRKTIPVIVRELDDDAAIILMVDANQQRENLLPSEKAFAYRMKSEAMKRKAGRPNKENGGQLGHYLTGTKSRDELADESGRNIQRYIRLTYLEKNLLRMVDEGHIAFGPAVEISFLKHDEQCMLLETIITEEATPSLSQAQTFKKLSQEGKLDRSVVLKILSEQKGNQVNRLKLREDRLMEYFPSGTTPRQMEETIFHLLDEWKRRCMANK